MNVTLSVPGTFFFMNSREILYRLNNYSLSCLAAASGSLFYLTLSPWAHFGHLTCQHIIFVLLCLVSLTWYVSQIHKGFAIIFFFCLYFETGSHFVTQTSGGPPASVL